MKIVIASRNKKKVAEIERITSGLPIEVLSLADYPDCPDVVEDQNTFEGNAVKKAVEIMQFTGLAALSDDSGLEVEALGGAPGVYSARYAGEPTDDKKNCEKLLSALKHVPDEKRSARFVCCMALALPDGRVNTFFGYVNGRISRQPRGSSGFGYDPVFIPDGFGQTFAEMSPEQKDALSHRGKALEKLSKFLQDFVQYKQN